MRRTLFVAMGKHDIVFSNTLKPLLMNIHAHGLSKVLLHSGLTKLIVAFSIGVAAGRGVANSRHFIFPVRTTFLRLPTAKLCACCQMRTSVTVSAVSA
jgi:hypothetical protein